MVRARCIDFYAQQPTKCSLVVDRDGSEDDTGDSMREFSLDYIAAGGNRHPSAADWKPGLLAFGAGKNVAIWNVDQDGRNGISQLLAGHTEDVNAVRISRRDSGRRIITGSSDKTIRIWERDGEGQAWCCTQTLDDHSGSINALATLDDHEIFVSGAADGTCKIWSTSGTAAQLVQTITLKPRYLPLTCALSALEDGAVVLAVGGTSNAIQLYTRPPSTADFQLQATLTGHEGWIRSLDFARVGSAGDLLLASASQDKYIRLWRFSQGAQATTNGASDPAVAVAKKSLSNKAHQVGSENRKYNVTFEALLIGHEDWIYTVRWAPSEDNTSLRLLSSSADNSLAIWQADKASGVWVCQTRLGEISSQKGSTTATGSTGGFWIGLWQPDGKGVVSLGRTGSWRRWQYDDSSDVWQQQPAISGHVKEVQGLAWAPDGSYLLSTSSDQTTRLWAEWQHDARKSWHEFARPQIHGYDLNCIAALTPNQFISGADEKLLRVFDKPKAVSDLLSTLCGHPSSGSTTSGLPQAANIPVLGLSNKAISTTPDNDDDDEHHHRQQPDSPTPLTHPPFEDHLARHTLFPELDKLYGHGYEISAVSASPCGTLVATACKASATDHALIRLYRASDEGWREVRPALKGHSLTVTAMDFDGSGEWLVSVARDRSWGLWRKTEGWTLWEMREKAHGRMILDCAWAPRGGVFATAGRDKVVKIWRVAGEVQLLATLAAGAAVTAVAFAPTETLALAYGTDDGGVSIATVSLAPDAAAVLLSETPLPRPLSPSAAVNALRWRPRPHPAGERGEQLAIASDDHSVRIVNVSKG